jgi:hypothetical protein
MSEATRTIERPTPVLPDARAAPSARRLGGRLSRATTVMVLLTLCASVVNYGSNLAFSRLLSPASYGDLTALIAFTVIAAVPTAAAQTVVAERVAVLLSEGRREQAR